ncbi:MAG: peroxiredoxin Q/BCP [Candidatus Azotimanducaceae bacterium]
MKKNWLCVIFLCLFGSSAMALEVGDTAPDFSLEGTDGQVHRLSDYRGEKAVVLAWFPKAYTSGCTIECKSLAENGHLIRAFNVAYFMASVDPIADNVGFAAEQEADFPLLSDPSKQTAKAYNVLNSRGTASRYTYYIGLEGKVLAIDKRVRPATSAEDMAAILANLGIDPVSHSE